MFHALQRSPFALIIFDTRLFERIFPYRDHLDEITLLGPETRDQKSRERLLRDGFPFSSFLFVPPRFSSFPSGRNCFPFVPWGMKNRGTQIGYSQSIETDEISRKNQSATANLRPPFFRLSEEKSTPDSVVFLLLSLCLSGFPFVSLVPTR